VVGTRQHRIVLVEDQRKTGIDRYTLKKYYSRKITTVRLRLDALAATKCAAGA
jgi:hypothetical protein